MQAKLIAWTQHPEMSPEEFIAYCARVSNPGNQYSHETSDRLLAYLQRNAHWSPFEMSSAVMEVTTTRDIARQMLRHRSFSFQEFSQRYADPLKEGLGFSEREARLQDHKNRQNSVSVDDDELQDWFYEGQIELFGLATKLYTAALDKGIAKEQARAYFPEGLTVSKLYMAGTIRSWMHYCELRMSNGTQKEHIEVASACYKELGTKYPILFGNTNENQN